MTDPVVLSALKMALAFVEDELERRRVSTVQHYITEAATTAQHLRDALRVAEPADEPRVPMQFGMVIWGKHPTLDKFADLIWNGKKFVPLLSDDGTEWTDEAMAISKRCKGE